MHPIFTSLLSFSLSFVLAYLIIPVIIRIARKKQLFAEIDERSSHSQRTPALGGIAIFIGILCTSLLALPHLLDHQTQFLLAGLLIIFLTGAKDDIEILSARNKTLGLLIGIFLIVVLGDVRLRGLYGLFGYYGAVPELISIGITIFTIFVITNAFNLIDGINGLAASLGIVTCLAFGIWFFSSGIMNLAVLAFASAGGLMAFLRFNVSPAMIFMGDSGSLVLGALSSIFAVSFIDLCATGNVETLHCFNNPVAVAVTFLIVPLFDTLRVFVTRMLRGRSPFQPDRRHIHHLLVDTGRTHMEATLILSLVSITFIGLVFWLDDFLDLHSILFIEILISLALTYILHQRANEVRALPTKSKSI